MFGFKKICALLCASLGLCSSNIKAAGNNESLQNRSALTGFNVGLDEFISEELERTKIEGSKNSQFGAETFLGNGALPLKRKEAIRARGAQSVLRNDEVLRAYFAQDSGKLRRMSKNEGRLSNGLYTLSWPSILLALGIPSHDAIKGIRMFMIFNQCVTNFKNMSEADKAKLMEFYRNHNGVVANSPLGHALSLRDLVIGAEHLKDKNGSPLSWDDIKNELNEVGWSSIDFKSKIIEPIEKYCEILHSFGYEKKEYSIWYRVLIKDLEYAFFGGVASTVFNSVLNNLSQREQGKSDELNVLADKVDQLKKMKGDKKSFVKKHLKLKAQAESSNIVKKFPNTLKKS